MHKLINKIMKNDKLKNNLNDIKYACTEVHKDRFLLPFSDHGIQHSERMISAIESLCKNLTSGTNSLNIYECFILVSAIYLHDVGLQMYNDDELEKFRISYGIKEYSSKEDFIRTYHHCISKYWIESNILNKNSNLRLVYFGDNILGMIIANVVESHGKNSLELNDTSFKGENIRVKLLCSLLCLADALDCDMRRIDIERLTHSEIPNISKIHWYKHYYVDSIKIKNGSIKLFFNFPSLEKNVLQTYKIFFVHESIYWIEQCKKQFYDLYQTIDLNLDIVEEFSSSQVKIPLNVDCFEIIQEKVVEICESNECQFGRKFKIAIGILKKDDHVLMVKRKIPEGNLIWQFPTGMIKPYNDATETVIKEVFNETGIEAKVIELLGKRFFIETGVFCYYFALEYVSGELKNGDTNENEEVGWVHLKEYKNLITSDIFTKVKKYLS